MLIESHRHTAEDLRLWRNLESADRLNYRLRNVGRKVERSQNVIRDFIGDGDCYVGVSWGKDSVVVAHLAWNCGPSVPLIYLRQSNENPDCIRVRDAYLAEFNQPYFEIAVEYQGEVSHANPAWKAAHREAERRFGRRILGIRGDESGGRMIGLKTRGLQTPRTCSPIGWWAAEDVFAYLAKHRLPVNPVYGMLGGGRYLRGRLRTASIGGTDGEQFGRNYWEKEYYGDLLAAQNSG